MWMCVHMCCKLGRALSHYCLVQSIFNVWWNKICLNQSNVQISLLNFSLYYEWFNFYNPLSCSTSLSKWKSQLIILTCPAMIQRWSSGLPADAFGWLSMSRLPAGHPWVTIRCPDGEWQISVRPAVGFFPPITPQIPTGRRAVAGRWQGGVPRDAGRWVNLAWHRLIIR